MALLIDTYFTRITFVTGYSGLERLIQSFSTKNETKLGQPQMVVSCLCRTPAISCFEKMILYSWLKSVYGDLETISEN